MEALCYTSVELMTELFWRNSVSGKACRSSRKNRLNWMHRLPVLCTETKFSKSASLAKFTRTMSTLIFVANGNLCSSYIARIEYYQQRIFSCSLTGKSKLTYEEALASERAAKTTMDEGIQDCYLETICKLVHCCTFILPTTAH